MVNVREVNYYGLLIRLEPVDDKPFYLTGETSSFNLRVVNLENRKRKGKLSIKWRYGFGFQTPYRAIPVEVELEPKETKESILIDEWHRYEGSVACVLEEFGSPEDHVNITMDDFLKKIRSQSPEWYVLCTYRVMDKATYEEEKKRYETLLEKQEDVKKSIEKLREDITKIAREEARKEVYERLAKALQLTFAPSEEKVEKKVPYRA